MFFNVVVKVEDCALLKAFPGRNENCTKVIRMPERCVFEGFVNAWIHLPEKTCVSPRQAKRSIRSPEPEENLSARAAPCCCPHHQNLGASEVGRNGQKESSRIKWGSIAVMSSEQISTHGIIEVMQMTICKNAAKSRQGLMSRAW